MTKFESAAGNAATPAPIKRWAGHGLTAFIAIVFLDSLRFKFSNAPKTQIIFGDLDQWSTGLGAPGLFAQGGLFSQYVIGGAELVAALLLISTMFAKRYRFLQPLGAMLSIAIMSGAISFHLFTPLGINVDQDGGALFYTACAVWIGAIVLLLLRQKELRTLVVRLRAFVAPEAR
ncbi:MAG: hypothetical protein ACKVS5_11895 [Parvularculaceae bacterium]